MSRDKVRDELEMILAHVAAELRQPVGEHYDHAAALAGLRVRCERIADGIDAALAVLPEVTP